MSSQDKENRERFLNTMGFRPGPDRLPMIEFAGWWNLTLDRWYEEGLPRELESTDDINRYLGLDMYRLLVFPFYDETGPKPSMEMQGPVVDMDSYRKVKEEHLYRLDTVASQEELLLETRKLQDRGEIITGMFSFGFFWTPRQLMGIEGQLYAFHDKPDVIHAINRDMADFILKMVEEVCKITEPDWFVFAEDMSYKGGPMISKAMYDEFLAPYYRQVIPAIKEHSMVPLVDSDGNVEDLLPWLLDVGIEGVDPLERRAGCDIVRIRERFPRIKLIGGYDKNVMSEGEEAMRAEFERILPVMKQGGYVPSVDHQTPPSVSLENYRTYVRLLEEYCTLAVWG